jgi:hypothetical protein
MFVLSTVTVRVPETEFARTLDQSHSSFGCEPYAQIKIETSASTGGGQIRFRLIEPEIIGENTQLRPMPFIILTSRVKALSTATRNNGQ